AHQPVSYYRVRATFSIDFSLQRADGTGLRIDLERHQHSDKLLQACVRRLSSAALSRLHRGGANDDARIGRRRERRRRLLSLRETRSPGLRIEYNENRRLYCHRDVLLLEFEFFAPVSSEFKEKQSGLVTLEDEEFDEPTKYLCAKVRAKCLQFIMRVLNASICLHVLLINSLYINSDFVEQTCLELVEDLAWSEIKSSNSFLRLSPPHRPRSWSGCWTGGMIHPCLAGSPPPAPLSASACRQLQLAATAAGSSTLPLPLLLGATESISLL
uniref:BTB/POZ domain-containing protein n=1 Tax=Macrostomum lignano TaxID=282301 RepID=A0A1I8FA92_9PLAT